MQDNILANKRSSFFMTDGRKITQELDELGFTIIDDVYTDAEVDQLLNTINATPVNGATFRKTKDLFAIRQFLKEVPDAEGLIFNHRLTGVIQQLFGSGFFVTKSIYFDKPAQSNWFVAYHQDLTISVDQKTEIDGYGPWTVKQNQFAVQPPVKVLENSFTIRIHLDDTDQNNGALKVVPGSNLKGIYRPETINWQTETETICNVKKGGIMIMRPLLLHTSNRSTNQQPRRVIHIEFSNSELPPTIKWSEKHQYTQHE
ncbi:phytanoyl-CoA dioxygenase family protein [Mucilaginibacter paludis]|uniref:Phytanoyl-CoA dioxygenase n=1 Tax=Mucilaginibacter paludis DSM 18603 TaxID=714943 RepID=H1Y0B8_9SPHI|nr:phytanoyl-CoA dioxygenase family protein [Mucilaginibacter paludis]EHQ28167.1 Phytanoyl-CoA dioxygenase [Mucilaginibacter paludis DSM 18603]